MFMRAPSGVAGEARACSCSTRTTPWSSLRAIIGRQRIVDHDLAPQRRRNACRHRVVAVELPVRIVRGEQQHIVGTQMFDRPVPPRRGRPARRTAGWSGGHGRARSRRASGRPTAPRCAARARTWRTATGSRAARSRRIPSARPSGPGYLANTPSQIRLASCDWKRLRLWRRSPRCSRSASRATSPDWR